METTLAGIDWGGRVNVGSEPFSVGESSSMLFSSILEFRNRDGYVFNN